VLTSSLSTPSSRSSVRSTWLLCAAAKVGDRPRVGLSDCSCLAALPVAAPCPQHDGCFGCRELDGSSGRVAAVVQVTPGRGGARMSAGPAFGTLHLDRTFPSCSLANPLHHPVHPHPRTVAKGTANSTRRSRGKGNSSLTFSALDAQPHSAQIGCNWP
jgi:hypothetical protein